MSCTLAAIDNNHLVLTTPKTRTSRNWVAVSPRVATALEHRARSRARRHSDPSDPFSRPDGQPLRPHTVLDRLQQLSKEAGVPRVTVHDLRHLAATITITAGMPLTVVSKTLRHSTLSTTANIYSHLTQQAAREAVDTIDQTLTRAQKRSDRRAWLERLRPPRDHHATTSPSARSPHLSTGRHRTSPHAGPPVRRDASGPRATRTFLAARHIQSRWPPRRPSCRGSSRPPKCRESS
ncbi:tyrosine-type recombinase/integrase [Streptomyces sp. NPDC006656]|uniref:tyrosine-type recombinase/integrase n=1 Tax=Streptomyces sp. NPDC006656 TaxID=3156899 RepID=UPI0034568BDF